MSKNVNNDVAMNPPVLDALLYRHENLSGYSVKSNRTRLEQVVHTHQTSVWCTKYQSSLPLRFEYRFTLRRRGTERYPVYDNPLQDWRGAALFRYKTRAEITVVMCDHVVFRVDARAFRYRANIASIKKGKQL